MAAALSVGGSNLRALMRPMGCCRPTTRHLACIAFASKGFGTQTGRTSGDDEKRQVKRKRVNIKREEAPIPNQGNAQGAGGSSSVFADVKQLEDSLLKAKDDEDFSARLALVRQEGQEKRRDLKTTAGVAAPKAEGAVFEGSAADIYANPPSLSSTLMNQLNADVSDPKLKSAQIGPNQVAVAVSAIVFGLIFVLVSGADFAPSKRYQGVSPANAPPDALEASLIKGRIAQLENARQANPNDVDALEGLAVSYAQLFEFDKAADLLEKLVKVQPRNAEAWRLLGETTLLSQQPARSVTAYERAAALNSGDLQVLTGLADAYIANAEQGKAITFLTKLKDNVATTATTSSAAAAVAPTADPAVPAAPVEAATEASAVAAASEASPEETSAASTSASGDVAAESTTSGAASTASTSTSTSSAPVAAAAPKKAASSQPPTSVDAAALDLLTAKVYSRWRGHDSDALATYDTLIQRSPEDFRGYLAKGLFLKERGQKSDAERMFIQARFYAPESRQRFINQVAGANPVLDLPSND